MTKKAGILTVIDQAGQLKQIVGVTIMDYNKNTVFGVEMRLENG